MDSLFLKSKHRVFTQGGGGSEESDIHEAATTRMSTVNSLFLLIVSNGCPCCGQQRKGFI